MRFPSLVILLLLLTADSSVPAEHKRELSWEEQDRYDKAKEAALERILGPMADTVGHAIVPFKIGGTFHMYYFPNTISGTGFATMELIEPDGTGPMPNRIGTYELVAFTKQKLPAIAERKEDEIQPFAKIQSRLNVIMTMIGRYSYRAVVNPGDTLELPWENEPNKCIVVDEYDPKGVGFVINGKRHSLLLVMEIMCDEMRFAMKARSAALFKLLKDAGYYPYSDLDRKSVLEKLYEKLGPAPTKLIPLLAR